MWSRNALPLKGTSCTRWLGSGLFLDNSLLLLEASAWPASQVDRMAGCRSHHRCARPPSPRPRRAGFDERLLEILDPALRRAVPGQQLLELAAAPLAVH